MKRIIILLTTIAALLFNSCSDWLDVDTVNSRTTDNFYTTPSEMGQGLIGIYNALLPLSNYSYYMSEIRSDNTWTGEPGATQRDYQDISSFKSNILQLSTLNSAWTDLYAVVARANLFLEKIEGVSFDYTDEVDVKASFMGEARFLRALAYFELVRYFGRVPISLSSLTIDEGMSISQSEDYEVYEQVIIPDLEYAIEYMLDEPIDYKGAVATTGRAARVAAKALLGRVYLTMSGYPLYDTKKESLAEEQLEGVIDYADATGKYWAETSNDWERIWISDNDNKYHIFEIQYIAQDGYGNPIIYFTTPKVSSAYISIEMGGYNVTCTTGLQQLLKENLNADGTYADVRCLATIDTTKFARDDGSKYSGDNFFVKMFEHKIKRTALGYEDIDAQIVNRNYFPINYPLIRLEDAMLMYAEIVGPTEKGIEMVNRIRTRAGLETLTSAQKTAEAFQTIVAEERRRELAFEGIRWHDLVRQNNLQAIRDNFIQYGTDKKNEAFTAMATRVTDHTYIYPIPDVQMKVKEGLYQQNPGYN